MASNINIQNINVAFPVSGQDNNSQGFRDNFLAIQAALGVANIEISALQSSTLSIAGSIFSTVPAQLNNGPTTLNVQFPISSGNFSLAFPGTGAVILPMGGVAQRPTPYKGQIRYNSDFNYVEYYNGTNWYPGDPLEQLVPLELLPVPRDLLMALLEQQVLLAHWVCRVHRDPWVCRAHRVHRDLQVVQLAQPA